MQKPTVAALLVARVATMVIAVCAGVPADAQTPLPDSNQAYPAKPVKFILPFPPGGATEVLSRLLGARLQQSLGQPFLVEPKPGAAGTIATHFVAKAPPDGYTLLMGAVGGLSIAPTVYKNLPYNPERDLVPVILVAAVPSVVAVLPSFPAKNIGEFIALTKTKPDGYSYGSPGLGSATHLAGEMFKLMTGAKLVHVPYKGSGPAIIDLEGGHIPVLFESLIPLAPHIRSGKVRALAVSSAARSPVLPDVPTLDEAGVKGFEQTAWYGVVAPGGTPKAIVEKLNAAMANALSEPELKQRLVEMGSSAVHGSPEQFAALIRSEIVKWREVIKASGIAIE